VLSDGSSNSLKVHDNIRVDARSRYNAIQLTKRIERPGELSNNWKKLQIVFLSPKKTVIIRFVHALSQQRLIDTSEDGMPHGRNDMHVMAQVMDI
jgi:hypothetical protein